MAFTSVAPIYDVVIILSSPPLSVKSFNSLMIRLTPLHFMKDTIISIRSADTISFFNSPNSCGSFTALVKSELCAIDVSGRITVLFWSMAYLLFSLSSNASSCSARSSTDIDVKSSSPVLARMTSIILLISSIFSGNLSSPN